MTQLVPILLLPAMLATIIMVTEICSRSSLRIGVSEVPRLFAQLGYQLVAWFYFWTSVRRSAASLGLGLEVGEPDDARESPS